MINRMEQISDRRYTLLVQIKPLVSINRIQMKVRLIHEQNFYPRGSPF